ncbi:SpoIID/LytB domain-containing protein [candidate division KSB1 bacterium]|nr:SpoIID/LytB domain-containing protein [candidate division KSB1 bacterium]
MKKYLKLIGVLFTVQFFCVPYTPGDRTDKSLHIRVGILEDAEVIQLTATNQLQLANVEGTVVGSLTAGDWQIGMKQGKAARRMYRLLVLRTRDEQIAADKVQQLVLQGKPAYTNTIGRKHTFDGQLIVNNQITEVYLDKFFNDRREAEKHQKAVKNSVNTEIIEDYFGDGSGIIWIRDLQQENYFQFPHTLRLYGAPIILRDIKAGAGFHWEGNFVRQYTGIIEMHLNKSGKITVINELPLERYLQGVVPSEMPATFPVEALKAQAVAARTIAIRKMGIVHPNQPFDVCDDVHCQVYQGISNETEPTNRAVSSTHGKVLAVSGNLCDAVYAAVCGGHTEAAEHAWQSQEVPYLKGVLDYKLKAYGSLGSFLQNETNVRQWITGAPKSFCNPEKTEIQALLNGQAKYFRWQVQYSATELAQIIQSKTGQNLGKLNNLEPVSRGVSGRLKTLRVVGSKKSFTIDGELEIRRALSQNTLYSSCFVIDKLKNGQFILRGAGFGHGVGMCQYGAAGMALKGKNYLEILLHYYNGAELLSLYQR